MTNIISVISTEDRTTVLYKGFTSIVDIQSDDVQFFLKQGRIYEIFNYSNVYDVYYMSSTSSVETVIESIKDIPDTFVAAVEYYAETQKIAIAYPKKVKYARDYVDDAVFEFVSFA